MSRKRPPLCHWPSPLALVVFQYIPAPVRFQYAICKVASHILLLTIWNICSIVFGTVFTAAFPSLRRFVSLPPTSRWLVARAHALFVPLRFRLLGFLTRGRSSLRRPGSRHLPFAARNPPTLQHEPAKHRVSTALTLPLHFGDYGPRQTLPGGVQN